MSGVPHFPVLRGGKDYESLDRAQIKSSRDGTVVAEVSQANSGMVRRDLRKQGQRAAVLRAMPIAERIERCAAAARIFMEDTLPLSSGGGTQSVAEYIEALSSTSGLPHRFCRGNMAKIAHVMAEMPAILAGLTRGMDPNVLDTGIGDHGGVPVWYTPTTDALGAVLPSNSPGVHSLWVPAIALGVPVVLKPGREEPWTPMRIARAMMAAGIPPEAFSLYPTDHEGSATILESCGRSLLFGDARTTAPYVDDPRVEIHGPGRSKVILGADVIEDWRDYLDVIVASVTDNGGRSCINASSVFVPSHGDEIAAALAERMGAIEPRPAEDEAAPLAAFANAAFAQAIDASITQSIENGGATELTSRPAGRLVELEGSTYLLPTVVRCASLEHPLANTEYLFPFTSVVEVPQDEVLDKIGTSLVVTAITRDPEFLARLTRSGDIHRLNLGPVPTSRVEWDQPHEGNLFEFLYERRALQRADW